MKKTMRVVLVFLIYFTASNFTFCEKNVVSGRIYFEDNTSIEFVDLIVIWINFLENHIGPSFDGIPAKYENSVRIVPYTKLKYLHVKEYNVNKIQKFFYGRGTLEIETITGVAFECWYDMLDNIKVRIKDKLTGDIIEQDFPFINRVNGRVMIKKIQFNN